MSARSLALLSLGGACLVLGIKIAAYLLTDSVAFLSDAAESVVNVVAGFVLLRSLNLAARPADYEHPYGHSKAEYLSSALEGGMILVAAGMILVSSLPRLLEPEPLNNIGWGVGVSLAAAVVNGLVALLLIRAAHARDSAALRANARHLLTDVWTSLGVVAGVGAVALTGRALLDPLIAVLVALNIVRSGVGLLRGSLSQLMDERLPEAEEAIILGTLNEHPGVLGYHRLRSRKAGASRFAEIDIFVTPSLSVAQAHELVGTLEDAIHRELPNLVTTIHVEPFEAGVREGANAPKDEFDLQD